MTATLERRIKTYAIYLPAARRVKYSNKNTLWAFQWCNLDNKHEKLHYQADICLIRSVTNFTLGMLNILLEYVLYLSPALIFRGVAGRDDFGYLRT